MRIRQRVPTNLITGPLGAGKTTAILRLLARRPAGERWAVLVNEFGAVGIDGALLPASDGVVVRELPGGCLCCTLGVPLRVAVTGLLRRQRPDRLLIEPSGVGHPGRVVELLRGELAAAVELRSTLCLIDPMRLHDPRLRESPLFQDQVRLADALIASKCDRADTLALREFHAFARGLRPTKALVAESRDGQLELAWLDAVAGAAAPPLVWQLTHNDAAAPPVVQIEPPRPRQPRLREGEGAGYYSVGWLWHPADRFAAEPLLDWLRGLAVERFKGVFQLGAGDALLVQGVAGVVSSQPSAYRRDSRFEVIDSAPLPAVELAARLRELACG